MFAQSLAVGQPTALHFLYLHMQVLSKLSYLPHGLNMCGSVHCSVMKNVAVSVSQFASAVLYLLCMSCLSCLNSFGRSHFPASLIIDIICTLCTFGFDNTS